MANQRNEFEHFKKTEKRLRMFIGTRWQTGKDNIGKTIATYS